MLGDLYKQQFDVGIGGLNFADSILFRYLEIPYIKLSEEDIESYSMQVKMNIPVLMSAYPSSQIYAKKPYHEYIYDFAEGEGMDRYMKSLQYRSLF